MIEWDEVVKQILESDFSVGNFKLKVDDLTCLKGHRDGLDKLRSIKSPELTNLIKCMLIISPDKNDRRGTGRPLVPKEGGWRRFNDLMLSKYRDTPSVEGLITDQSGVLPKDYKKNFFIEETEILDEGLDKNIFKEDYIGNFHYIYNEQIKNLKNCGRMRFRHPSKDVHKLIAEFVYSKALIKL